MKDETIEVILAFGLLGVWAFLALAPTVAVIWVAVHFISKWW